MSNLFVAICVVLSTCAVSASTINGPAFTDLAILPSETSLNPTVLGSSASPQRVILDPTAANFSFDFSLAHPTDFVQGITQVILTATPNLFTPLQNLTLSSFSATFVIDPALSSVNFAIFIGNSTANNTYYVLAVRQILPAPTIRQNDYTVFWIVLGIVALVGLIIIWFTFVAWKSARQVKAPFINLEETVSLKL